MVSPIAAGFKTIFFFTISVPTSVLLLLSSRTLMMVFSDEFVTTGAVPATLTFSAISRSDGYESSQPLNWMFGPASVFAGNSTPSWMMI